MPVWLCIVFCCGESHSILTSVNVQKLQSHIPCKSSQQVMLKLLSAGRKAF